MKTQKSMPEEVAEVFDKLKSEIIWLHGRWIIFEQLYGTSPERVELLNEIAPSYFRITQDALLDGILIYIGRITDKPKTGKNTNLSIGQIIALLDREKYSELITRLEAKLEDIKYLSGAIRQYRNKNLVHSDIDVALKTVEPLPVITFEAIKGTMGKIRDFMNECEGYFQDRETAYEAFTMSADGQALVNRLKKVIAYEELEKQGLIERGYWRMKSRYKGV